MNASHESPTVEAQHAQVHPRRRPARVGHRRFRFGAAVALSNLTLHVGDYDSAGGGNVPAIVDTDLPGAGPETYQFIGLGLFGQAFDVRLHYQNEWVFVREIILHCGASSVPAPDAAFMMGFGLLGIAARSLRRNGLRGTAVRVECWEDSPGRSVRQPRDATRALPAMRRA